MTIQEYLAKHGSFKTARAMLERRVNGLIGLGLDDLADTCEIAGYVEEIEGCLEVGDIEGAKVATRQFSLDDIEENVFG